MGLNLGELAKKLLVNPIVGIGKAVGRDYQNTVYGPDWRERAMMRREMFSARKREMESEIERRKVANQTDLDTAASSRAYREALTGEAEERRMAKERQRRAVEAAAREAGMSVDEYEAAKGLRQEKLKTAVEEARIAMMGATTEGKEAWTELGLPSLIARNNATAARALRPSVPRASATARGNKISPNELGLSGYYSALKKGDVQGAAEALSKLKGTHGRSAFEATLGADSPMIPLLFPEE